MNELLDDDVVIARLRSALDEVTAATHRVAAASPRRASMSSGRWMAVAAASVLVVAAVVAVAVNRRNSGDVASTPTETVAPNTTFAPTTTSARANGSELPWFVLASPDLVPGLELFEPCCATYPPPGPPLVMAWTRDSGLTDGLLLMTEWRDPITVSFAADATLHPFDGGVLSFTSYGLTKAEEQSLADQVTAGSGLPWVLPAEGWQFTAMGRQDSGLLHSRPYSNQQGVVTISVSEYRGQLAQLVSGENEITAVTVAGHAGWKAVTNTGDVVVVWPAGTSGAWATMEVSASLAERADGLIAAVGRVSDGLEAVSVPPPNTPPPSPAP